MKMHQTQTAVGCQGLQRMHRRRLLGLGASAVGWSWLTPLAEQLARAAESSDDDGPPRSLILLWLQGGPSQLETFDPHPGTKVGGDTRSVATSVRGLKIADTLPQTAEQMHRGALIRSMVSQEGDHERATYYLKTGWRPDPTLVHPSIGAVLCHQSPSPLEIPRHVSILASEWPARGGYLGPAFDAFRIPDPADEIPNLQSHAPAERLKHRLQVLQQSVEQEFARGRYPDLDARKTQHQSAAKAAVRMMESEQREAFEVLREPASTRRRFGDTPFGRGCLAAIRLIERGVRCVEVELSGWDSHINNHEIQSRQCRILDAALAATINELHARDLLERTLVFCGGEFGRTPVINPTSGRDHWPNGFSTLLAGCGIRVGTVLGETSAEPSAERDHRTDHVSQPVTVPDLHATMLAALGVEHTRQLRTPIGRPLALSDGKPRRELLR